MKKLIAFYFLITLPLVFIYIFHDQINGIVAYGLIVYALVYRPVIDYARLRMLNIHIKWWKLYIPWKRVEYFNMLYFKA